MTNEQLILLLKQLNEAITAATVIVAFSMLLYNLTRGLNDRVARSSSGLLACVTIIYIGDVFVSLGRTPAPIESWLRFEWIGLSFAPAALFHLSDGLLSTTGLISRGRRRRVTRLLYIYGAVFLLIAAGTNLIVRDLSLVPLPAMQPGPLFSFYLIYFVAATVFALNNVLRARRRCLTRATHRRMSYLLFALVTPAVGIFPYSLLFPEPSQTNALWTWILINVGNVGIILMLIFMAYPLSFFGPKKPERVIKAELLSFMLRGPVMGVAVLLVVLFLPELRAIGIPGADLVPFAAVATVLSLQWLIALILPHLERILIYNRDQDQARQIHELSQRFLTPADARQLMEAILASICDYLRVPSAFVVSFGSDGPKLEQSVGSLLPAHTWLDSPEFAALFSQSRQSGTASSAIAAPLSREPASSLEMIVQQSFWLLPLRGRHANGTNNGSANHARLIGVMGIWARSSEPDLQPEEQKIFKMLYNRVARVLDDMHLQEEVFSKLEDVLEEAAVVVETAVPVWGNASEAVQLTRDAAEQADFIEVVKNALRDYWGGPRLTDERLVRLNVVSQALAQNENNPAKAVRDVLSRAIDRLKPEGQRSMTMTEWTLYNILELRFIQGHKARDVAPQLAMSEADLYRKQAIAIRQVAREMADMEQRAAHEHAPTNPHPASQHQTSVI